MGSELDSSPQRGATGRTQARAASDFASEDRSRIEALVAARWNRTPARIDRIEAGLGARRFYRVEVGPDAPRLVARIEPDVVSDAGSQIPARFAWHPEPDLERIRHCLETAGLPVPHSFGHADGIDLLEDLGTCTLTERRDLDLDVAYQEARALIPKIQAIRGDAELIPAFGRVYDAPLIRTKAEKFLAWVWPGLLGREASASEMSLVRGIFDAIADSLAGAPRVLSHRDFKAENLLWRMRDASAPELVMIDVQGAFMAPPEYDLVCLLWDMQVERSAAVLDAEAEETLRVLTSLGERSSLEAARRRVAEIGLTRLAKDVAHVVDAAKRRGDDRRWHEVPYGLGLLSSAVERLVGVHSGARELQNVISTLTEAAESADSQASE